MEIFIDSASISEVEKWLKIETIQSKWDDVTEGDLEQAPGFGEEQPDFFNEVKDLWRIVEVWYRKLVKYSWFINPVTGEEEGIPSKDFAKFIPSRI